MFFEASSNHKKITILIPTTEDAKQARQVLR